MCSGSAKEAAIGNVNGGDVVRFIHRFWGGDTLMVRSSRPSRNATLSLPENFHWLVIKINFDGGFPFELT